ncbi:MAG: hypothetical protein HS116_17715 [Planctomycetes bacterium]|nr:hypothetical protein [Planctomycetota bacterium]
MQSTSTRILVAVLLGLAAWAWTAPRAEAAAPVTYVDILRPTGGEVFVNGQQQLIAVQLHSKVSTCTIELSRDGGLTFTEIVGTINNLKINRRPVHEVVFPIVGPDSPECVLRATALVSPKNLPFTDTTAVFTIGSPNLIPGSVTESILSSNSVSTIKIQDGAVTSAKIADGTVSSADIADGAVGSADIADGSVSSTDIADGTIATGDLADGSVTNPKIADLAVTTSKLGDGAVTSAKILDGTIAAVDIANATITPAKLQQSDPGQILIAQGVGNAVEYKALSGDVLLGATGLTTITAGAVGTSELIGQSVTRAKLERAGLGQLIVGQGPGADMDFKTLSGDATLDLNGALVINNSAITTGKIADNAITTGKILDGQVQTADLADASVTNAKAAPEIHRDNETKDVQFVGNGGGTTFLNEPGSSNTDSGAFLVGVFNDLFDTITQNNVQGALKELDTGLTGANRKFSPFSTPDNSGTITLDADAETQVNILGGGGLRVDGVSPLDGVNGLRQITVTVINGGLTATQIQDTVAGDGLSGGTPLNGVPGTALAVNVAAPLSIVTDTVSISDDGINGTKLADDIVADNSTQEISFPQANGFFQLNFDGSSSGNQQIFRINRGGGAGTDLLFLEADGDLFVGGNLDLRGNLFDGTDGIVNISSSVNLGANNLTTTGTINAGTINANSLAVSGISSATNAIVTIDNDDNGANTFQIIGNSGGALTLATLDETSLFTLGPTSAATPKLTTQGSNNLTLDAASNLVIVDAGLQVNGVLNMNSNNITNVNGITATTFTGNGAALTNVDAATLGGNNSAFYRNATNINAGTIGSAFLPANVALLDAIQTFSVTHTFQPASDSVSAIVRQTTFAGPSADIFQITNPAGATKFFFLDANGRVQVTSSLLLDTAAGSNLTLVEGGFSYNSAATETLAISNAGAGQTDVSIEGNLTGNNTTAFTVTGTAGMNLSTGNNLDLTVTANGAGEMDVNRILNAAAGVNVSTAPLTMGGQNITGVGNTLSSSNGTFTVTSTAGSGTVNLTATGAGNASVNATGGTVALNGTAASGGTITTNTTIDGAAGNSASSASATPSVINLSAVIITADTTITNLTGGIAGQVVTIVAGAGTTSVQVADAGNFALSAAFNGNVDDTLTVVFNGTQWIEVTRASN